MSYANGFDAGYATGISDREDLIEEINSLAQQVRDLKDALSVCKVSYSRLKAEIENKRRGM